MYHSSNLQMYGILKEILLGDRSVIGTYIQILLIPTTFSFGNRFDPIYKKLHPICGWIIVLMRSVAVIRFCRSGIPHVRTSQYPFFFAPTLFMSSRSFSVFKFFFIAWSVNPVTRVS